MYAQLIHYSRQIILPEIDEHGQETLKLSTVLIVGLGGLGSPAALYLAAAGVGNLVLVDDDPVETSNLQRQIAHSLSSVGANKAVSAKARLEQINASIKVTTIEQRFSKDIKSNILNNVDLILDCSDNYQTRFLLNQYSLNHRLPLVHGSAIKFEGHVTTFNQTPSSPCYNCLFNDEVDNDESCEDKGVFPPIVGLIGTLQAAEALKIILGCGDTLDGLYQRYNLLTNRNKTFKLSKNPDCNTCTHDSHITTS